MSDIVKTLRSNGGNEGAAPIAIGLNAAAVMAPSEQDSGHQEEDCLRDAPREDSRTPSHSFLSLARPPGLVCPAISLSKIFSSKLGVEICSRSST